MQERIQRHASCMQEQKNACKSMQVEISLLGFRIREKMVRIRIQRFQNSSNPNPTLWIRIQKSSNPDPNPPKTLESESGSETLIISIFIQ